MHSSSIIANRFLELAKENNKTLTPMQLLKLVYIAHGWMLGLLGRPLIKDDIQAWQYGPVIPKLYNQIREYKSNAVTKKISCAPENIDEYEEDIIDQVYKIYGQLSGPSLSALTHQKNSPWELTYDPNTFGSIISNDLIEDHYKKKAAANENG